MTRWRLPGDGELLLAANNAEDPPFATLFSLANGDAPTSNVFKIIKISVDPTIIPAGKGLSLEQPAWDPKTQRFYTSIPTIANNPAGCVLGGTPACSGGVLVTDPDNPIAVEGAFNPSTGTGVIPLPACGPNGATVGVDDNVLLGCTPGNYPPQTTTLVINAKTYNTAAINGITGSDEVFFNKGDGRYYLASKAKPAGSTLGSGSVMGVVSGSSVLIETIPSSSGSHSVADIFKCNLIFLPQIYSRLAGAVPAGDANTVGEDRTRRCAGMWRCGRLRCGLQAQGR